MNHKHFGEDPCTHTHARGVNAHMHILSYVHAFACLVRGCAYADLRQNFCGNSLLFYEVKFKIS